MDRLKRAGARIADAGLQRAIMRSSIPGRADRARHRATLRRDPHGAAGRRDDPLRRRARRRRSVPDLKRRLPGRGVWVTATPRGVARRRSSRKALRPRLQARRDGAARLVEATERLLEHGALRALAIARKAGHGRDRLRQGRGGARPASGRGPDPRRRGGPGRGPQARCRRAPRADCDAGKIAGRRAFTSAQLDLALGRSNVIHAALLAGRDERHVLARVPSSSERFRTGGSGDRGDMPD